jgi:D-arabinose 1-dehydrogenase-like Zn-dependent alcohol dehydrogenase
MHFAAQSGVRPITEQAPLDDAARAFDKMLAGQVRYRGVLTPSPG